jgi:endonuclease/exonuclease/phosphatase (EEP) superfamily protein YafD
MNVEPDRCKKDDFFSFRLRLWGVVTAAGTLAAATSAAGFFGRFAWWLDIWSHFRVQYAFGFAALAICYLLGRKPRWGLAASLFFVLNAVPVIALLLPSARLSGSHGDAFRAILLNVNTHTGDPGRVIAFIEREQPDIVVLEEIDDEWVKSLQTLFQSYAVRAIEPRSDNFGIVLLSRKEAVSTEVVHYGQAKVPTIVATLRLDNRLLTLIATHPLPPAGPLYSALRDEQLDLIGRAVRAIEGPVLLLGDLNATPWSYHYRALLGESGLRNSSRGRGLYATWPTFAWPLLIPLDHALHSEEIVILDKRVGPAVGSDHYPVIVDFAFRGP